MQEQKLTWKEKAEQLGIILMEVKREDGSIIDGQYEFEYKYRKCFTYISSTFGRDYCVGSAPYGDGILVATDFDHFIQNFEKFIRGTRKYKETIKNILVSNAK